MNLVCSTCQKLLSCPTNCPIKPVNFNQPTNSNKNNSNSKKEIIELAGTLQRSLGNKQDKNGKTFYFGSLWSDNDNTEKIIFFFDPDYNLLTRINLLNSGDHIKVAGFFNRTGNFTVRELIDDGGEIF